MTVPTTLQRNAVRARALRRRVGNRVRAEVGGRLRPVRDIDGVALRLGPHVAPAIQAKIMDGSYERPERHALRGLLADGDRVLDVGAGLGLLSTICARRLGSDHVTAVEANPHLAPTITETFEANDVAPTLHTALLDVGDPLPATAPFFVHEQFWRSSTVRPARGQVTELQVPVLSATELIGDLRPTVVILDIEGGEVDLLPKLPLDGVTGMVIETHPRVIGADGIELLDTTLVEQGFSVEPQPGDVWLARR